MKRLSAMIFAFVLWAGYAAASEATPRIRVALDTSIVEELTVTAIDLSYVLAEGIISVALTDVVLVHNYDPEIEAWVFVGSNPKDHIVYVEEITDTK